MSPNPPIDDGYEENPWDDDPPGELVPVKDFLPSPERLRNAVVHFRPDGATFFDVTKEDLVAIDRMATERGTTFSSLIAGVLHDFATGQLIKRQD